MQVMRVIQQYRARQPLDFFSEQKANRLVSRFSSAMIHQYHQISKKMYMYNKQDFHPKPVNPLLDFIYFRLSYSDALQNCIIYCAGTKELVQSIYYITYYLLIIYTERREKVFVVDSLLFFLHRYTHFIFVLRPRQQQTRTPTPKRIRVCIP